ncbi:hypothetical protein CAEBREN_22106 [Caenorhabditis brenneri]|uniref:F-box domain-containing protein n=1 Tax=Caenorhabditis brenneri TaxID=135651 RepID=G0N888_CAEBE|nr:hypothetical protein CAEBREN_22106 [Caenorhabditis brenneri]
MEVFKENIVDGMIYTFHFQHFPATAAHIMIGQMIGSDICSLQYVEELYKKIEEKKFSLKKPQLLDMPPHFLENVVKELDVESRAIVRKTCKTLRAFVDHIPLRLEYLAINFSRNPSNSRRINIKLHFADIVVSYYEQEEGCLVTKNRQGEFRFDGRERFVNGDVKQLVLADLKSIFLNPKLEIEGLAITKTKTYRFNPYFTEFIQMLSSLEHKVHVERFSWSVYYNTDELVEILSAMKPSTLKSFESNSLYMVHDPYLPNLCLELNKCLFNLPQWKGAKELNCTCKMNPRYYVYLAQFDQAYLTRNMHTYGQKMTVKTIMALKKKLLENENFVEMKIFEKPSTIPVKGLKRTVRPFQSPINPRWAQFDYPNSVKKLLLRVYSDHIWFKGPCYESDEDESEEDSEDEEFSEEEVEGDSENEEPDGTDGEDEEHDGEIEEDSSDTSDKEPEE